MNRYRVLPGLTAHLPGLTYAEGEEFEYEYSEEDETTNVASGLLEIVPRAYQVVGGSEVDGHAPGETFDAAIPLGREALLVAGGHIARVEADDSTEPVPADPIADEPVDEPVSTEPIESKE